MIDVTTVKIGDTFVLRQNDPEKVTVVAKDKEGNSYRVSKSVPRIVEIKIRVADRVIETRETGGRREWLELEYSRPAVDDRNASKQLYLIPVESSMWNEYERI